jgi:hypothetical protein
MTSAPSFIISGGGIGGRAGFSCLVLAQDGHHLSQCWSRLPVVSGAGIQLG